MADPAYERADADGSAGRAERAPGVWRRGARRLAPAGLAPCRGPGALRVAVVGAGFGGLAAAIRLRAAGIETVLFEARDQPGGRAYVYRDDGFTFDAGPTVLTAPHCLEELYALTGRRLADAVELVPVHPYYRLLWPDGARFDYDGDPAALRAEIARLAPDDLDGYERFYAYSGRVFAAGYDPLVARPFLKLRDLLRVAPTLARLRADRPVYRTVARYVRDEHLRQALSFHSLLIGGNPFETSSIYTLIHFLERKWGVYFARGGTGALVRALAELFVTIGGELRLASPVRRVRVEGTRHRITSRVADDEPFDAVVSNADLFHTYASLYREDPRAQRTARRLNRLAWSMSLFLVYFGTDRRYPGIAHHSVIFSSRYEALLREIFHGAALPSEVSLYLHAPTVTDPLLAPPGCECFYVLSPVPNLAGRAIDWERIKEAYADRILAALEEHLPNVRAHVVTRRLFTPRDFERELAAHHGAAFSLAPRLTQSAWFRPHNRDPRIPGLYLVGAGTHPGPGVPGVVNSAKATVATLLEDMVS
jgi:phytoene desaturase